MAGRRGQKETLKTGVDSSTMVYVSMAFVLIVLSATLYIFGIDFGFVHFGGTPNVNILYAGGVVCMAMAYVIDAMYIRAIRRFYKHKITNLTYVPYVNFISVFSNRMSLVSWILVGIAAVIALPALTPIGQFMPVDYLVLVSKNSVYAIIAFMTIFTLIRGYYCFFFKKKADEMYKREISENYGAGGGLTFVSYIIYFLPIIRSISLLTDLNFINTIRKEIDEMHRGEER